MFFKILITIIVILCVSFPPINSQTCNDNCKSGEDDFKNCFCNECELYGDCCSDTQNSVISEFQNFFDCNLQLFDESIYLYDIYKPKTAYSVSKCPTGYNADKEIKQKCERNFNNFSNLRDADKSYLNFLPVYNIETNFAYKNIYCAICHKSDKFKITEIKIFNLIFSLTPDLIINQDISKLIDQIDNLIYQRDFSVITDNIFLRLCKKVIEFCQSKKCNNETAFRYSGNTIYKNEECAKCNTQNYHCDQRRFIEDSVSRKKRDDSYKFKKNSNRMTITVLFSLDLNSRKIDARIQRMSLTFSNITNISNELIAQKRINLINTVIDQYAQEYSIEDNIKFVIMSIGFITSIISLIILMIVYFLFERLRNFQANLTLALSATLLFSQLFFFIGTSLGRFSFEESEKFDPKKLLNLCSLSANFTHYFFYRA